MNKPIIIVVDDEPTIIHALKTELRSVDYFRQYDVEGVDSSSEAIEVIEEANNEGISIVCVIVDQIMPDMLGSDFLVAIHKSLPYTSKIMLTGQASKEDVEKVWNILFAFRQKPWDKMDMLLTISQAIANTNSRYQIKDMEDWLDEYKEQGKEHEAHIDHLTYQFKIDVDMHSELLTESRALSETKIKLCDSQKAEALEKYERLKVQYKAKKVNIWRMFPVFGFLVTSILASTLEGEVIAGATIKVTTMTYTLFYVVDFLVIVWAFGGNMEKAWSAIYGKFKNGH